MANFCGGWGDDPGPCPVDDTPHTACTPESVAQLKAGAVTSRTVVVPTRPPLHFSTAEYRRALHGPAAPLPRSGARAAAPATSPATVPPLSPLSVSARVVRPPRALQGAARTPRASTRGKRR